jgi:hypothetical protein
MKELIQKIDTRSRKAMIEYLQNHFRYYTMNSWNLSTSYANKMKIYSVIPQKYQDKIFEMIEADGFYDEINELVNDWGRENNYAYQAGFNGRSGGYLVMYEGSVEMKMIFKFEKEHPSGDYADGYGWMQKEEAIKRGLYRKEIKKVSCWPGRSIDKGEDFEGWDLYSIKQRVVLVQSFDKLCQDIVNLVIDMAKNNEVEEETYVVTKTRKVIV